MSFGFESAFRLDDETLFLLLLLLFFSLLFFVVRREMIEARTHESVLTFGVSQTI
jgi:hypothetical protein